MVSKQGDFEKNKVFLITGPSGAGRSTALNYFEDKGFDAIDNIPVSFVEGVIKSQPENRPLAIVLDVRNREFESHPVSNLINKLMIEKAIDFKVIYLEAGRDVIIRRYSETRRPHPLAIDGSVTQGIILEERLLEPIKYMTNIILDTSRLSPIELHRQFDQLLFCGCLKKPEILLQSFSYKNIIPQDSDLVFDCRFLSNPHWDLKLRPLNGRAELILDMMKSEKKCINFLTYIEKLLTFLVPNYVEEGRSYITISFGCTGGKHRSVAIVELLSEILKNQNWSLSKKHLNLNQD